MKRDPMGAERVPPRLDMESMHSNRWREGAVVDRVEVVLVTWARAKDWPAMDSADRKGYAHPVTASLFGVSQKGLPGIDLALDHPTDLRVWSELEVAIVELEGDREGLRISSGPMSGKSGFFRLRAERTAGWPAGNP